MFNININLFFIKFDVNYYYNTKLLDMFNFMINFIILDILNRYSKEILKLSYFSKLLLMHNC